MVDLESLILYIKIQPQSFLDSGREDFRVFFYHILTWQSSCSTVQNHLNKLSILLRQKAPCETWWTLAECFQRRRQDLCNQWRLRQPAHLCSLISLHWSLLPSTASRLSKEGWMTTLTILGGYTGWSDSAGHTGLVWQNRFCCVLAQISILLDWKKLCYSKSEMELNAKSLESEK